MMSGKVPKLSTESKGNVLARVVTILVSAYLALVSIVLSCTSGTNSLTDSLGGAESRRLSIAQRYYEKKELPERIQVRGLPHDYEGFNGLYQREGSAGGSRLGSQLGSRLGSQLGCQAGSTGGAKVGSTVGGEVGAQVGKKKGGWLGGKLGRAAGSWTGSRTGSKIGCQSGARAGSALGAHAGSQIDSRLGSEAGFFKNTGSDAKLLYQEGRWVLQMNQKRAICPKTDNGRLPQHETWKLQDGQAVQIKMQALLVDPGHEGSSFPGLPVSSGGNRRQPESKQENSHTSRREGMPNAVDNTGNRAKNEGGRNEHSSKDSNPDRRDQNDDPVMTGVAGNQLADSSALDNFKREVGSDEDQNDNPVGIGVDANHSGDQPAQEGEVGSHVDQHKPLVMTGVDANHSAEFPGQENFEGEVGSDVDQNDDPIMTGVGANHDGELGFDVDQNEDSIMTGVDANHSADSPGQDDLNGEINPEIHRGEKLRQNSGGDQNHSSPSGAQSMFTAEADMTDDNSSGANHSLPAPAQDDLKREPAVDAHRGNRRQPKSDGQNHSHDSTAQSNLSGIAKSDGAHHMKHVSKNSRFDQTNRSSSGYADTELDFRGANHTNMTVEETPEIFSFHSILAILAAVLSLMCACVCLAVSCFWRASEDTLKQKDGCWGVENSETEAILPR